MVFYVMTQQDIFLQEISLYLTIGLIGLKFSLSFFYMRKYLLSEMKNKLLLGIALLFLFLGIGRVFFAFFDFYLTNFNPDLFQANILIWKLGTLFSETGVGILILIAENKVFGGKDRYIFFIGYLIFVGLAVGWPDFQLAGYFSAYAVMFGAFILFSYIYLAIILEGEARKRAIFVIFGFLFFAAGSVALNEFLLEIVVNFGISRYIMQLLSPILKIIAAIFLSLGFLTE